MAQLENKFIVINWKHLDNTQINNLSEEQLERIIAIDKFREALNNLSKYLPDNKYYACNQDEPYAEKVLQIILEGEHQKANPVENLVSQAASQAMPEPNANEQKIFFDNAKDKILDSLLKDIPFWDLKNDDINECLENVKELFASM